GKTMNRVAPHGMASRDSQTAGLCCRLKPAAHAARLAVNRMLPHVLRRPTMTRYVPFIAIVLTSLLAVQTARAQGQLLTGEMVLHTRPQKEIKFGDRIDGKQVYYPFSGRWPFKVREEKEG